MKLSYRLLPIAFVCALTAGCQSAYDHAADVGAAQGADSRLTMGTVQRQIRVGMPSSEVAEILGAPNMVTTDEQRRETWVYDKVSTQTAYSGSAGGFNALILGVGGAAGARSTTQRTLTVVVKFDRDNRVRDFSYRSSSF